MQNVYKRGPCGQPPFIPKGHGSRGTYLKLTDCEEKMAESNTVGRYIIMCLGAATDICCTETRRLTSSRDVVNTCPYGASHTFKVYGSSNTPRVLEYAAQGTVRYSNGSVSFSF